MRTRHRETSSTGLTRDIRETTIQTEVDLQSSNAVQQFVGRRAEFGSVTASLEEIRPAPSALILEGEPGIGKSTLWRAGVELAGRLGYVLLSSEPAEAEAKLSFVGLGDLLEPVDPSRFE